MTDVQTAHEDEDGESLAGLRRRLHDQAQLFEEPGAYVAGVEDALAALDRTMPTVATRGLGRHAVVVDGARVRLSEQARYLAALALGLVTAGHDDGRIVEELIDAAEGSGARLRQAARSVYALRIGDAASRRAAERLLRWSVDRAESRAVSPRAR